MGEGPGAEGAAVVSQHNIVETSSGPGTDELGQCIASVQRVGHVVAKAVCATTARPEGAPAGRTWFVEWQVLETVWAISSGAITQ